MTIGTTDFPTWFLAGFSGGLVCCVLTIIISLRALYTKVRPGEMTRRLFVVLVVRLASSFCLLFTFIWFHVRFNTPVSLAEIIALLSCVAIFGWLLPMNPIIFSSVLSRSSVQKKQKKQIQHSSGELHPPRHQSGVMAPFVFSADVPWGWLEYRNSNFQGQRLALKRSIITLGRAEDCDIWLDDDGASRRHAEVAWENNVVYLTDCESLNSTCLNGRQVQGSVLLSSGDIIEIGAHRFLFILAEPKTVTTDQDDPLVNHKWRSSFELQDSRQTAQYSLPLAATISLPHTDEVSMESQQVEPHLVASESHTPPPLPTIRGMLLIENGELAGKRFFLQSLSVTVGSGPDCDLVVQEFDLAPQHARFIRELEEDYMQDLSGQNRTLINDRPLQGVQSLHPGDRLRFGSFHLTYLSALPALEEQEPYLQRVVPDSSLPSNGLTPLRLPSRPKES